MDKEIAIRPATERDIVAMWDIDQLCFEPGIAYPVDVFYYHLLVLRDPCFVAVRGDAVAGFVLTSTEKKAEGLIVTIDVLPEFRGRGLGKRLMAVAEEALAKRGAKKIVLQTAIENATAISFYEKLGYQKGRLLKNYYAPGLHAFQYSKPLP